MTELERPADPKTQMPWIAGWIENLRASLGNELVDAAIRNGLKNGTFWAIENQYVVGTPPPDALRQAEAWLSTRPAVLNRD